MFRLSLVALVAAFPDQKNEIFDYKDELDTRSPMKVGQHINDDTSGLSIVKKHMGEEEGAVDGDMQKLRLLDNKLENDDTDRNAKDETLMGEHLRNMPDSVKDPFSLLQESPQDDLDDAANVQKQMQAIEAKLQSQTAELNKEAAGDGESSLLQTHDKPTVQQNMEALLKKVAQQEAQWKKGVSFIQTDDTPSKSQSFADLSSYKDLEAANAKLAQTVKEMQAMAKRTRLEVPAKATSFAQVSSHAVQDVRERTNRAHNLAASMEAKQNALLQKALGMGLKVDLSHVKKIHHPSKLSSFLELDAKQHSDPDPLDKPIDFGEMNDALKNLGSEENKMKDDTHRFETDIDSISAGGAGASSFAQVGTHSTTEGLLQQWEEHMKQEEAARKERREHLFAEDESTLRTQA